MRRDLDGFDPVRTLNVAIDAAYRACALDDAIAFSASLREAEQLLDAVALIDGAGGLCAMARFHMLVFQVRQTCRVVDPDASARAISMLKRAVRMEPHSAAIHGRLAEAALAHAYVGGRLLQTQMVILCHTAAKRALELDVDSSVGNAVMGLLALFTPSRFGGSVTAARAYFARAIRREPRPDDWAQRLARAYVGMTEKSNVRC